MHTHAIYGLAVCLVSIGFAQSIKVSGTVKDAANKPVANAIVELLHAKGKDTTGADGMYSLNVTPNSVRRSAVAITSEMSLRQGILELATAQTAPIRIEILDVKGHLLDRMAMEMASPGTYRLNLAGRILSQNLVLVKATVGRTTKAFPYLPTGFTSRTAAATEILSPEFSAQAGASLAKVAAAVDTLQVSASGFVTKRVELTVAEATVDVTLEVSMDIWGGLKNPPAKSTGCGKPATLTNGAKTIMAGGTSRNYVIEIPANYDPATPYRLFFVGHGMPGAAADVPRGGWWGFKAQATAANVPAIWIAPGGIGGSWSATDDKDHVLFDVIIAAAKEGLCIDTTRIFAMGMSGGGMLSFSLSTSRQKVIRAGVAMAPVNYRIYNPTSKPKDPIAWMQTTGMGDRTCPWVNNEATKQGAKFIAFEKAADNGCTIPAEIPTWKSGNHVCYDFAGCKPGYPTKICTFNGPHTHVAMDPGSNVNWIAKEGWDFFMQF
ncbi:MAG: prolyl oligopeptidase family serine peptidase [Fibrobacteria bacterium]